MRNYYVIKDKTTGLYFRGKGANRWGKHFNQASIYRVKGMAEHIAEEITLYGGQVEIVPIQIIEGKTEPKRGVWEPQWEHDFDSGEDNVTGFCCSICGNYYTRKHTPCSNCGTHMEVANDPTRIYG